MPRPEKYNGCACGEANKIVPGEAEPFLLSLMIQNLRAMLMLLELLIISYSIFSLFYSSMAFVNHLQFCLSDNGLYLPNAYGKLT